VQPCTPALYKGTGSLFGSVVPLDQLYMMNGRSSSVIYKTNGHLNDKLMSILANRDNEVLFRIKTNIMFNPNITLGDTVEVFTKGKNPWTNGKWIIGSITYVFRDYSLSMDIELIRSSFIGDKKATSLETIQTLFEA